MKPSVLMSCVSLFFLATACSQTHESADAGPLDGSRADTGEALDGGSLDGAVADADNDAALGDAATDTGEPRPDAGPCGGPNPQGCSDSSTCEDGNVCVPFFLTGSCRASACSCTAGGWICTADCGGGSCLPINESVACDSKEPMFPEFDRACTTAADCELTRHQVDCCGGQVISAVNASDFDEWLSAEGTCREQAPAVCDCVSPDTYESGEPVGEDTPAANCIDERCVAVPSLSSGDRCGDGPAVCGAGLSCCYPCGIEGCENVCEPSCDDSEPGCSGGCLLRP